VGSNTLVKYGFVMTTLLRRLTKCRDGKKDQKEFKVSVTYHEHRGCQAYLPRPIIEVLVTPKSIEFIIKNNKKVEVRSGD
jgi:hypothetical protein